MRSELLQDLRCVSCNASDWSLEISDESDVEYISGSIICNKCSKVYKIIDGIIDCIGELSLDYDETEGWINFASNEGWCLHNADYLNVLPFNCAKTLIENDTITWDRHSRNFFRVLSYLDLSGKQVLDLGAGRCWSTKYLSLQNARCVAVDLVASDHVGLRTATHYIKTLPIYFERIRSDMNDLPFMDNSFDIVFAHGAIHHSTDLERTLKECYRILSKGGLIVYSNEWCSGLIHGGNEICNVKTMPGINEHNYRAYRQYILLRKVGFRKIRIIPDVCYFQKNDIFYHWLAKFANFHPVFLKIKLLLHGGVLNMIASK